MNVIRHISRRNVSANKSRYTATVLVIVIAVAFMLAGLSFGSILASLTKQSTVNTVGKADVVFEMSGDDNQKIIDTLRARNDVSSVQTSGSIYIPLTYKDYGRPVNTAAPLSKQFNDDHYYDIPPKPGEVYVSSKIADEFHLAVGDTVHVGVPNQEKGPGVKVSKIMSGLLAPEMVIDPLTAEMIHLGHVVLIKTTNPDAVISLIKGMSENARPKLASTYIQERTDQAVGVNAASTIVLLIFPLLTFVVAVLVVSTTYAVVVKARTREIALLRAIGASGRQTKRLVRHEAIVVGAVASALGVLIAVLGGSALLLYYDVEPNVLAAIEAIGYWHMIAAFISGVLLSWLASSTPARTASQVAPLEAMRLEAKTPDRRTSYLRIFLGGILFLGGSAGMYGGYTMNSPEGYLVAFFSGIGWFIGLCVLMTIALPSIISLLGKALPGLTAKMARRNAVREPARTGATGTAIIIGVTLVTLIFTATASLKATVNNIFDSHFPIDLKVQVNDKDITPDQIARIKQIKDVQNVEIIQHGMLKVVNSNAPEEPYDILVERGSALESIARFKLQIPREGHVFREALTLPDGTKLATEDGTDFGFGTVLNPADFDKYVTKHYNDTLAIKFTAPDLPIRDIGDATTRIRHIVPGAHIDGGILIRSIFYEVIKVLLATLTVLLGISVLVALVGMANTISLSVIERQRENSLLRAVGLTARRMRGMLALEASLIGGISALVGCIAGVIGGVVAIVALPFGDIEDGVEPIISIPVLPLIAIIAIALLASLLASLVPGLRASRAKPVEALRMN